MNLSAKFICIHPTLCHEQDVIQGQLLSGLQLV